MRQGFPWVESVIAAVVIALIFAYTWKDYAEKNALPPYDTLSTYDPAAGGFKAWYELLRRENVRVERFEQRPAYLDESVDVYVLAQNTNELIIRLERGKPAGLLAPGDFQALHDWVARGGRLVWLADGQPVALADSEFNLPAITHDGLLRDESVSVLASPITVDVNHVSGESTLRVPNGRAPDAVPLISDGTGAVVATYGSGKGSVIVVTDESLFQNRRLAQADNARLAYNLAVAGLPKSAKPTVAFDEFTHGYISGDTWWTILPKAFRQALVIVIAALLLLLLGAFFRFGPVARLPEHRERSSAEFLTSMAILLARGRAARRAVRDLADTCIKDVAIGFGLYDGAPIEAIASRMQRAGGGEVHSDALRELDRLRALGAPTGADLVRAAQLGSLLRKEYTRHGQLGFRRRQSLANRPA